MEIWVEKVYHCERAVSEEDKEKTYKPVDPVESLTMKSLISNHLCMGMQSPCVTGTCEVMCGYGRRYLREKGNHAG